MAKGSMPTIKDIKGELKVIADALHCIPIGGDDDDYMFSCHTCLIHLFRVPGAIYFQVLRKEQEKDAIEQNMRYEEPQSLNFCVRRCWTATSTIGRVCRERCSRTTKPLCRNRCGTICVVASYSSCTSRTTTVVQIIDPTLYLEQDA